ncbi:MAG: DUF2306 domain-containing protein [Nitratireductor sp.]
MSMLKLFIFKNRILTHPVGLAVVLLFFSLLTIVFASVQAVQIPLNALPEDSARLKSVPVSHFLHAVGGVIFGILGPLQFGRVLAKKYGRVHRVMGRVFVLAGAALSLSSLTLLWNFPDGASPLVSAGRLVFGIALGIALIFAMVEIRKRNITKHRDWMIRAYAVGIGATPVAIVLLPIFLITGEPPTGLVSDIAFVGSWALCVVIGEYVVRYLRADRADKV